MSKRKNILAIIGSAASASANLKLVEEIARMTANDFDITIYTHLKTLPHFDPEISVNNPPEEIIAFRNAVHQADGLIISTPEYIFSIPSGLKNAIEWCIATTVFANKPTALITASANGQKAHEELQLIMKTAMAKFSEGTTLLIQGIKGKIDEEGKLKDEDVIVKVEKLIGAFRILL
ncbi:MAG: NADPH-dependent FMN reductase [Chitinophagaceae bacterium]|jgi:NAD(P)H-dependent FMN reductase